VASRADQPCDQDTRAPDRHMSTTMTLTMAPAASGDVSCCPNCGVGIASSSAMLSDAQRRIEDLEAQVRLLNQKCTSAGVLFLCVRRQRI
jgi:hypothetical protein